MPGIRVLDRDYARFLGLSCCLPWPIALLLLVALGGPTAVAQVGSLAEPGDSAVTRSSTDAESSASERKRFLPLGADWARKYGYEPPLPFGAGLFLVLTDRRIEVTDVRVTLRDEEPQSIGDFAQFAVQNFRSIAAVRADVWLLPVLDLYGLLGGTWTQSNLHAQFVVDPPLLPPDTIVVNQDSEISGPLYGAGMTLAGGYGHWFLMADANYSTTQVGQLEGSIDVWFLTGRTGLAGTHRNLTWKAWLGAAYLDAARTLTLVVDRPILGEVRVDIDQRPVHPWTAEIGGGLGVGKRFDFIAEFGTNFDDATLFVLSGVVRF